jgi:hypothetical protein
MISTEPRPPEHGRSLAGALQACKVQQFPELAPTSPTASDAQPQRTQKDAEIRNRTLCARSESLCGVSCYFLSVFSRHRRTLLRSSRSPLNSICFTGLAPLAFMLEHARYFHPAHLGELQLVLADRPLVILRERAGHQHHRMRLLEPVFHPALLLDRENLRASRQSSLSWKDSLSASFTTSVA